MKPISRLLSFIFLIWCALVFISMMLVSVSFILIINWIFKGKRAQSLSFVFLKIWAGVFSVLCFYPLEIKNKAYRDSKNSFIYVCNHSSYLDAIAVVLAAPQAFKPLGKLEMVKVPVFGAMYKHLVVMVDRSSAESRANSVEMLKEDLKAGQSLFIFPEGTMNRGEQTLTEFYDGAFRIAIETQTPIAPMVLINASKLLHRDHPLRIKPGKLTMVFAEPVPVAGLTLADLPDLKNRVRQQMEQLILAHS
ncbi:MAG: lysophospholipid acyltransferase family protein [Sphingobacteriaceae bacterium]